MKYEFDVAISYKSEIEEKATKIADYLIADGWKVFFAPSERQLLLSEKLHLNLYDVYNNKSLVKLLLISETYLDGELTSLEQRASMESTKEDRRRLVIVNYIEPNKLPRELRELQYLDGRKLHEDEIASVVTERINNHFNKKGKKLFREKDVVGVESQIVVNHGIIAGDNAHFGNIQF